MDQTTQDMTMHFVIAYKWVFFLLPLPVLAWLLLPAMRKRRTALIVPFLPLAASILNRKPHKKAWIHNRNFLSWGMLSLIWICLIAAAASPRFEGKPGKKVRTVRSFLIAADISFSMAETDWTVGGKQVSRWAAVRTIMKDFVSNRKSDQIGLVMFATHAYLQAPLTTDLATIDWLLDETEVGMAGQMTSIGEAIAFSLKILKKDTIKQKVMLLLTDGIDEGKNINPLDAAQAARKDSVLIYTLGIGRAHGSGGYDLDEKTLKDIASTTGGQYFNAMNEGELKKIYRQLDKIEPIRYEEESYKPITLLYIYPLAAAIAIGLLWQLLFGIIQFFKTGRT